MPAAAAIALVTRYTHAHNRGDIDAVLACLADDVVHDANQGVRRSGKAAFAEFCRHMARCYEEKFEDIVIMATPDGARAAAEFNVIGTYLSTDQGLPPALGQVYRLPAGTFFALRGGLITRVTSYYNLTDWLTQVMVDEA
jgi:steroid delta-isomerase-like uncharacterized protein